MVIAVVIALTAPAAATNPAWVTAGTLTTVLGNFDLAPGAYGPTPCPDKPDNLQFTTTANGGWTLAGAFSRQVELPASSGNWYQLDAVSLQFRWGSEIRPTEL